MRSILAGLSLCLCSHGALSAQAYVVDVNGGGNFTDLQTAITNVPSGSVLRVRPGLYSPFTLQNKSLTILGDSQATVLVRVNAVTSNRTQIVGPTAPNQTVVLKNLWFQGTADYSSLNLQLTNLAGPVWLEDVTVGWPNGGGVALGAHVTVTNCANLHFLRCTIVGTYESSATPTTEVSVTASSVEFAASTIKGMEGSLAFVPEMGLTASASVVTLVACTVTGGVGDGGGFLGTKNGNGAAAVTMASGSVLHLYGAGSLIQGGAGSSFFSSRPGGDGGPGVVLSGSSAFLVGIAPLGGAPGVGTTTGQPGSPLAADVTSTVRSVNATGPSLGVSGTVKPGGLAAADLNANAGDWTTLLIGQTPLFAPAPFWLTAGTLFVDPQVTVGAFQVPANGQLSLPLLLPSTLTLDRLFVLQYAVLPAGYGEIWLSNASSILVKS